MREPVLVVLVGLGADGCAGDHSGAVPRQYSVIPVGLGACPDVRVVQHRLGTLPRMNERNVSQTGGEYPPQTHGTTQPPEPDPAEQEETTEPTTPSAEENRIPPHRPGTSSPEEGANYRDYDQESKRFP
jgi:hypothetical protein